MAQLTAILIGWFLFTDFSNRMSSRYQSGYIQLYSGNLIFSSKYQRSHKQCYRADKCQISAYYLSLQPI